MTCLCDDRSLENLSSLVPLKKGRKCDKSAPSASATKIPCPWATLHNLMKGVEAYNEGSLYPKHRQSRVDGTCAAYSPVRQKLIKSPSGDMFGKHSR